MINTYTGIPYDFRRYNCWHHVRAVRAAAGLVTPVFNVTSPQEINAAFDAGHAAPQGLTLQDTPQNFDAVLMGIETGGRVVWHAGVYYDGYVSHCSLASRQVRLDSLADIENEYKRVEFWR